MSDPSELVKSGLLLELSEDVVKRIEQHVGAFSIACQRGCFEVAVRIFDAHQGIYSSGEFSEGKVVKRQEAEKLAKFRAREEKFAILLNLCWRRDNEQGEVSLFSKAAKEGIIDDTARILDETADGWTTGNLPNGHRVDLEDARKLVQHFSDGRAHV